MKNILEGSWLFSLISRPLREESNSEFFNDEIR